MPHGTAQAGRTPTEVNTHWQLLAFAVGWRARSFAGRHHTALVAGVGAALLLALFAATLPHLAPWRSVTLTVSVEDSQFVSYVEVSAACCPTQIRPVGPGTPIPRFVLPRGDYTIAAGPSPLGQQQHWHYLERIIHVDGDRTFTIQGSYG